MPRKYPEEFRRDVIAVARCGDVTLRQVAEDVGVSSTGVQWWVAQAAIEDGRRPGVTSAESAEMRELRRRNRLLEQENDVLRRAAAYLSRGALPD